MITDLTTTLLADVHSRFFRLFVPVKYERGRLPTSLPEFWQLRHAATLSDSPVTAAAALGGHWTDHNLAAIAHLGACNFRCSYCYVDFRHLAGGDAFESSADEIVSEFVSLRRDLRASGVPLTILRVSGGEPFLAPELVAQVGDEMDRRGLTGECLLKVESNLSALRRSFQALDGPVQARVRRVAPTVTVHATLHKKPRHPWWRHIREGILLALDLGMDLYPAIGGTDWTVDDLHALLAELEGAAEGLAARLVVRSFDLGYVRPYPGRRQIAQAPHPMSASVSWEEMLHGATGRAYLARPRHEIRLR